MPGKIKVKVLAGRNLPVMDRASDTTDAFVEIKFGSITHKTDVCRKSLNPHWNNTEWYRFEVDESELQDEPLQLRLMDHDTYSANDAIGKVVISLAPLLAREANNAKSTTAPHGGAVMSGWIPVFDTMHGIRGELNVIVKVELFSDFNKYKTSSCGVQFFHCPMIPPGYRATAIHGFVEELIVNDDPEYQWIDKIRTPRASNEARQVAFIKLSNQVQRLVGLKAAELGANAVVGYQQDFDLEGEAGVVARAIGTAVSIVPLPTPSQPSNIPPCTQQQLKKYLDILVNDNESITDVNLYYQTHQEELEKLISILNPNASALLDETDAGDDDEKSMDLTRQSSLTSYAGCISLYHDDYASHKSLRHLSEDQTDLNKLLNKDADDSDTSGPLQKIKKLKSHFFSKKISSRRRSQKQDDQISLRSNSSDNSRISLYDIKNEFKKLKKLKKPKFCKAFANKEDEGEGMASILARSVIHARTNLACIAESQDSEHSPSSTMRRTSESEPTINVSDEDTKDLENKKEINTIPEIRCTSLNNINTKDSEQPTHRKISESCPTTPVTLRSENVLKLPGEVGYYGSVSSELSRDSSEIYSSSDEDDESSDVKTDTEKSIETTSSIVKSVMNHEVDPNYIAVMDKKLNILEAITPDINEIKQQNLDERLEFGHQAISTLYTNIENESVVHKKYQCEPITTAKKVSIEKCTSLESVRQETGNKNINDKPVESNEALTFSAKDDTSVYKFNSHTIKFNNPFVHKKASKSISAPSSPVEKSNFVYRSSKRIKRQLSKISKSNMIKSISHYSLLPKKKETPTPLSHPSSSSDIQSKAPSETVLGSAFLSYSDLLSLDKEGFAAGKVFHKSDELHQGNVKMYIGSEPVSRTSISSPSSLYLKVDHDDHKKRSHISTGLIHTAMETILLDKIQNLLLPTSPDFHSAQTKQFFNDVNEKLEKVEESRSNNNRIELNTAMSSKASSLSPNASPSPTNNKFISDVGMEKNIKPKDKSSGLVQTAMKTILIDKAQSILLPTTSESPKLEIHFKNLTDEQENNENNKCKNNKPGILQTILGPKTPDRTSPMGKFSFPFSKSDKKKEIKPSGLVHTAMETILMEKVQSVFGPKTTDLTLSMEFVDEDKKVFEKSDEITEENVKHGSLVHNTLTTSLMDKGHKVSLLDETLQSTHESSTVLDQHHSNVYTDMEATVSSSSEMTSNIDNASVKPLIVPYSTPQENKKLEDLGMTDIATQKMFPHESLIFPENVNLLPTQQKILQVDEKLDDLKSPGLIQTAIQTILIDKVQSLLSSKSVITPERQINIEENQKTWGTLESPGTDEITGQTILLDKVEPSIPTESLITISKESDTQRDNKNKRVLKENSGFVETLDQTIHLDQIQSLNPEEKVTLSTEFNEEQTIEKPSKECLNSPGLIKTEVQTILLDKDRPLISRDSFTTAKNVEKHSNDFKKVVNNDTENETTLTEPMTPSNPKSNKKLTRQDSVHSLTERDPKMSNIHVAPCSVTTTPVLQHFHPILSGAPLETIQSLPESSIERTESIDSDTNKASVCCNLHAACDADRSEREKENRCEKDRGSPRHARHDSYGGREPAQVTHPQNSSLNASSTPLGIHRRSSDSDLSVTPKGGSLNTSAVNVGSGGGAILRPSMNSNNLDMLEYPFLTMTEYPPGFIVHIGGTVCARSVKLVDGGGESAARAAWWAELRTELRAHARALRCNAVLAYCDTAAICEDVCVLSASGTAAVINLDCDFNTDLETTVTAVNTGSRGTIDELEAESCTVAHVPYSPGAGPYRAELATCGGCRRARVPSVLLATCAKPSRLASYAKAVTLTAVAARVRRAPPTSEPGARDISDQLPFLEYELHKLLLAKLRMQGANALFSLQTQIAVGERCVMALASGIAVRLTALPPPTPPRIKASENDKDALEIQKALWDTFTANRAANGYDIGNLEHSTNGILPEIEDETPALDLCADKDACVLELDEAEDVETARSLAIRHVKMQVFTPALKPAVGAPPHAFAQVWRGRLAPGGAGGCSAAGERHVRRALAGVAYKLRRLQPCALATPSFQLELPDDEIQLVVSGAAIPLQDPTRPQPNGVSDTHAHSAGDTDDDIFTLDEEQLVKSHSMEAAEEKQSNTVGQVPTAVSLTSLSQISGGRLVRRLCALRLLFVRETTAVRELGGLSGFLHTFTCEVLAIVRAYTAALGGNALTSFYITQLMLQDNAHKNQGQCLLSVGGDVVHITY